MMWFDSVNPVMRRRFLHKLVRHFLTAIKKAALLSHYVPADDPRVIACNEALAYHRFRSQLASYDVGGHFSAEFQEQMLAGMLAEIRSKRPAAAAAPAPEPEPEAAPQLCDDSGPLSDGSVAQPDRTAEEVPT